MKLTASKVTFLLFCVLFVSTCRVEEIDEKKLVGNYRSKVKDNSFVILHLDPDKSAIIESTFWYKKGSRQRRTNKYEATWSLDGRDVSVEYYDITQILAYHEKLSLEDYGIDGFIPGLTTSVRNQNRGVLDSVKLWNRDELTKLFSDGKTAIRPKSELIKFSFTYFAILFTLVFLLSGALGRKKPLIGGITGAVVSPILCYILISTNVVTIIIFIFVGFIVGLVAGLISSIFLGGLKGKGHSTGPSYMGGFSGGRGGGLPGGIILSDEERKHIKHQ